MGPNNRSAAYLPIDSRRPDVGGGSPSPVQVERSIDGLARWPAIAACYFRRTWWRGLPGRRVQVTEAQQGERETARARERDGETEGDGGRGPCWGGSSAGWSITSGTQRAAREQHDGAVGACRGARQGKIEGCQKAALEARLFIAPHLVSLRTPPPPPPPWLGITTAVLTARCPARPSPRPAACPSLSAPARRPALALGSAVRPADRLEAGLARRRHERTGANGRRRHDGANTRWRAFRTYLHTSTARACLCAGGPRPHG
ncbi:hypothetical protein CDD83_7256 [Cordyceps sp. RAO-2017]|nr:hypothetical protein CDD83_7256 [Cordyceps sp. RAO-2017]